MARSRYIKPEFFKDEDLARVSHAARLLFVGLWSLADRNGRLEDRPLRIKAELFPYEAADVESLLVELAGQKVHGNGAFILRYEVSGRNYIQIQNFTKHQHCHPKEPDSGLPEPAAALLGKPRPTAANPSESESVSTNNPSESVSYVGEPSVEPPDVKAEKRIKESKVGDERRLLALVEKMATLDPDGRDEAALMQLVTSYDKPDGRRVGGCVNPATLSFERVRKSISDAEAMIAIWEQAHGAGQASSVQSKN